MKNKRLVAAYCVAMLFLGYSILYYTQHAANSDSSYKPRNTLRTSNVYFSKQIIKEKRHMHKEKSPMEGATRKVSFGAKNSTALVFKNLCIERQEDKTTILTVYSNTSNSSQQNSTSIQLYGFNIQFLSSSVPQDHVILTNHTAYFVESFCLGNMHHFFNDFAFTFFALLQHFSKLNRTTNRQVCLFFAAIS